MTLMVPFETYDVFTEKRFAGNQLAVVFDADALSAEQMHAITREFNLSETVFVLRPESDDNIARARIFTPGAELPFAGHPTIGVSVAIARAHGVSGTIRLELEAGLFVIDLSGDGDAMRATFLNPNLPRETGKAPGIEKIAAAVSLPSTAIDDGTFRPRVVGSGGVNFLYARTSLDDVRAARLNGAAFDILDLEEIAGLYLYAEGGEAKNAAFHARMFAPHNGIPEDPATGSAACSLPGHIALSGDLADGEHSWLIEQGYEMGRCSQIHARITVAAGDISSVRVGGAAVFVQRGEFTI